MKALPPFLACSALTALALAAAPALHAQTTDGEATASQPPSQQPKPPERPELPGFAAIPGGEFTMGDTLESDRRAPWHKVNVSAFHMQQKEVSKAQWDEVRDWGRRHGYPDLPDGGGKAAKHPAQAVSWHDVVKWCNAKSEKEELTPCYYTDAAQTAVYQTGKTDLDSTMVNWTANGYRLPTEAEWEKAARGGLDDEHCARFPWGDTISHPQANFCNDGKEKYQTGTTGNHPAYQTGEAPFTSPVGSFAANKYGLYDMAGNVCEWCWDRYGRYQWEVSTTQTDPHGPVEGRFRVMRGGSWYNHAYFCGVAYRYDFGDPSGSSYNVGFRLARSSAP
ncbi:MAG: SUMF1/EgtB/PvdO family nonheme iron enzyme [Verrucomicrobia bacterium]|nr:SUMF1/EgtB/PvdO family nonheme iron enzyme [Verrucomicrobiota bacterium]